MEKNTQWIVVTFAILSLLIGAVAGSIMIPTEKEVIVEKVVEKDVEVPVEVPIEVEVEVEVEKNFDDYKQEALDLCLAEFIDYRDLDKYEEAYITRTSDEWNIDFTEDTKTVTINNVTYRIRDTLDTSTVITKEDKKCQVVFEEDEETDVNWHA